MPKNKRPPSSSDSSSDSDSGPEDRNVKKPKTGGSSSQALKNKDGDTYFELDKMRRISVREFKGKLYVDIREFYEKDGNVLPGKKGISLNVTQWKCLKDLQDEIDDAIREKA